MSTEKKTDVHILLQKQLCSDVTHKNIWNLLLIFYFFLSTFQFTTDNFFLYVLLFQLNAYSSFLRREVGQ